jgi:ATP-dependent Lon protease
LKEVILPKRNEGDLEEVPEQVRNEMTFHTVETVDQVLAVAWEQQPNAVGSSTKESEAA